MFPNFAVYFLVLPEMTAASTCVVTLVTLVRPFSSVCSNMCYKMTLNPSSIVTVTTLVRGFSSVCPNAATFLEADSDRSHSAGSMLLLQC